MVVADCCSRSSRVFVFAAALLTEFFAAAGTLSGVPSLYCDTGHDGSSNPCKADLSDYCCDHSCTHCGPLAYCEQQSPFRFHYGRCTPTYVGAVCANYFRLCEANATAQSTTTAWSSLSGSTVSYFDASRFVDPQESAVMKAVLRSQGVTPSRFTSVSSSAGWVADVVVVPETESARLGPAMATSVKTALRNSVWRGALLIVGHLGFDAGIHACGSHCGEVEWLNDVFGWSMDGGSGTCSNGTWLRTASTLVIGGPPTLQDVSNVVAVRSSSLPVRAEVLYELGACASVVAIPYGSGVVVTLGYDWYSFTADWNEVLIAALRIRGSLPWPFPSTTVVVYVSSQAKPLRHAALPLTSLLALLFYV